MRAVLMTEDEERGLFPIAPDTPGAMLRLCGRPLAEYWLALLARHGVETCAFAVDGADGALARYLHAREAGGIHLALTGGRRALGTAGCVKRAAADGGDALFLAAGAEVLCDTDLRAAAALHRARGAQATFLAAGKAASLPLRAGPDGLLAGFELTGGEGAAGLWLLERSALELVPEGEPFDLWADLLPAMLRQQRPVALAAASGYFREVRTPEDYLRCQEDLLNGRVSLPYPAGCAAGAGVRVEGPVYIGENVRIGDGAVIQGPCALDDGAVIGPRAAVRGGICLRGAHVGEGALVERAVLCDGASAGAGASLAPGCVVGRRAVVGRCARLEPGVRLWPYRRAENGEVLASHRTAPAPSVSPLAGAAASGEVGIELTPEWMARLGCAVGSQADGGAVALGCGAGRSAQALKMAFAAGALSTGVRVHDFGSCFGALFRFGMRYTASGLGAYIGAGGDARRAEVRLMGEGGLDCQGRTARAVQERLACGDFVRATAAQVGEVADLRGIRELYGEELRRCAPYGLAGVCVRVVCGAGGLKALIDRLLRELGAQAGAGPLFLFSADGMRLYVEDEDAGRLSFEDVTCLSALPAFWMGRDVFLPWEAPPALAALARRMGRRAGRCRPGEGPPTFYDAPEMALRLLAFLKRTSLSLPALCRELRRLGGGEAVAAASSAGTGARSV